MKKLILLPFLLLFFCCSAYATHSKGGFIRYQHLEGRTYSVILTLYSGHSSSVATGEGGRLYFGDGTSTDLGSGENINNFRTTRISEGVNKNVYVIEHTYPSNGSYRIVYSENSRNENILNMENAVNIPFYTESFLTADPFIHNNSVRFDNNPVFTTYNNQTYHYNPQAYDPDGDSLSFHIVTPMQDQNIAVAGYTRPHLTFDHAGVAETGEDAYFAINPYTGDLIWDSPVMNGEYVMAIEIREWRKLDGETFLIGEVLQDFIVQVTESVHDLQLIFPISAQQTELEKDTQWEKTITAIADNPDDTVVLQLLGDFLHLSPELSPADSAAGKGEASITIQYSPSETGNKPYQLIARAYIYSATGDQSVPKVRSAYLVPSAVLNGFSDLVVREIKVYPNPSFSNSFSIQNPYLSGKEIVVSLFSRDGTLAAHTSIPSFSGKQPVEFNQPLSGYYLVVIRQGNKIYTSRILFSQK